MAVAGLASGLADGLRTGQLGAELSRQLGAGLAQVPAAWVLAGLVVAVFGLAPRLAVPAGWTVLAVAALLALLGPSLRLPQWLMDLSPFTHVPRLPGGTFSAAPLVWLAVVAAGLTAAGLAAFCRRDLT